GRADSPRLRAGLVSPGPGLRAAPPGGGGYFPLSGELTGGAGCGLRAPRRPDPHRVAPGGHGEPGGRPKPPHGHPPGAGGGGGTPSEAPGPSPARNRVPRPPGSSPRPVTPAVRPSPQPPQSHWRVAALRYSVTRLSKKFFSLERSMVSAIQGKGLAEPY